MKRAYSSEMMSTFHIMIAKGSQKGFEDFYFNLQVMPSYATERGCVCQNYFAILNIIFNFVRKFNINKVSLNLCLLK